MRVDLTLIYGIYLFFVSMFLFFRGEAVYDPETMTFQQMTPTVTAQPSPTDFPTPTPFQMPSEKAQQWLIATSGILAVQNNEGFDTLASQIPPADVKVHILSYWWGIETREDALDTLEWLKNGGQSAEFQKVHSVLEVSTDGFDEEKYQEFRQAILEDETLPGEQALFPIDFAWENREKLDGVYLTAWDHVRIVNIARWSYTADLITEKEAWEYIAYAGAILQENYNSWEEMGEHYKLGRSFWRKSYQHPQTDASLDWLLNNPNSPWITIPFDMEL